MRYIFLFLCLSMAAQICFSQTELEQKKQINALRIDQEIKIDGIVDEAIWMASEVASDFIQREPTPNIAPLFDSQVRILYDNEAIYIAAVMRDDEPEKIMMQMSERDDLGSTDWFAAIFDTYGAGTDGVGFVVSAAGVQFDTKYTQQGEDSSWDAVWESEIKINNDGWVVEMKIPFSQLRFKSEEVQNWSVNFARQNRRVREKSWWSPLRPDIQGFLNQAGKLTGIENIKSPLRLSLTPYVTTYLENRVDPFTQSNYGWSTAYNAGLDLKYGINDAFTLDMVLIPDFGQASSDQLILNLGPFEQFLSENRPFFTEGVEIFEKGNFFYSRRVGGSPVNRFKLFTDIGIGDRIIDNPNTNQLYNATKISGRTNKGLGVGFFNAVEGATNAIVERLDGSQYMIETNPLTNYNVLVLDQNLRNNSSISFINTNVTREGSTYDANVTGLDYVLRTKDQKWQLDGKVGVSQIYSSEATDIGHTASISLNETHGKFNYGGGYTEESDNYDPNDLGFLFSPNERSMGAYINFNEYEPKGNFNRYEFFLGTGYGRLYDPGVFTDFNIDFNIFAMTKNFFAFGFNGTINPIGSDDYFEPRTFDFSRVYSLASSYYVSGFISTDYNKRFAYDIRYGFNKFDQENRMGHDVFLSPRFRFNDRFNMILSSSISLQKADEGWVNKNLVPSEKIAWSDDDILFGRRDRMTVTNSVRGEYIFTSKMSLSFRLRHYWDQVQYQDFGTLNDTGELTLVDFNGADTSDTAIYDTNFNLFNIDLDYRWRFAPGSDLFFVWRQSLSSQDRNLDTNYFGNFRDQFDQAQNNSFSLRMVYFLDYNSIFSPS